MCRDDAARGDLDGIAAANFGVVSVPVIAELTKGTGRFNLVLGVVTTAVGIGAALLLLWVAMPETGASAARGSEKALLH